MKALVLRLDAPLLSFGTTAVDAYGYTDRFPGRAWLTGLFGNALGWRHRDADRLTALQARLALAARWDVLPTSLRDYQTVELGQPFLSTPGWTTWGQAEPRGESSKNYGTEQRFRYYWADGLLTAVVTVTGPAEPTLDTLAGALRHPARPLFLGRKSCLPARPLLDPFTPIVEGPSLRDLLAAVPCWNRSGAARPGPWQTDACWPATEDGTPHATPDALLERVYDLRDWTNQLVFGNLLRWHGPLEGGNPT